MRAFFADKFERDHHLNLSLITFFEKHEDGIPEFVLRSFSHILNIHYLWNCRLRQLPPDSGEWDMLPLSYFGRFENQNYQETINIVEHVDWDELIRYHSSEGIPLNGVTTDILFHLLQHSNYHRAQIIRELKQTGLNPPQTDLILFRTKQEVTK